MAGFAGHHLFGAFVLVDAGDLMNQLSLFNERHDETSVDYYYRAEKILGQAGLSTRRQFARLLFRQSEIYAKHGNLDDAVPLMERTAELSETAFGVDSIDRARVLLELELLYRAAGRCDEAETIRVRATTIPAGAIDRATRMLRQAWQAALRRTACPRAG